MLSDELETANLLEPHFIVLFVMALTKTSVNLFGIAMSGLLTRALKYNTKVRFLSDDKQRLIPTGEVMSICKTRAEAGGFYQQLFEAGAGAHYPNGVAERLIQTIISMARTMVIHAHIRWPDVQNLSL